MKALSTLLLFAATIFLSAQEIDSTAYFWFINDLNIDSVHYNKNYYESGELYEEGWVIQMSRDNSYKSFHASTDLECISSVTVFVGKHIFYYKNGAVETILSYPRNTSDTIHMFFYNKKGTLEAIDKFIERPLILMECDQSKTQAIKYFEFYHFQNYSKGALRSEGYYMGDYLKTGCWKYYNKKGELKKQRHFENNLLVGKSCN